MRRLFSLDLRSLAACRIATGLVILGDLLIRATEFRLFYTELSILPRLAQFEINPGFSFPNLYHLSDLTEFKALLFVLNGLLAVALMAGYRTRWVTVLCWYFQHCLMTSNYLANNGGDAVLSSLLFWSMFLPWGSYASLDSLARAPDQARPTAVYSAASVAFISQILLIYWVSVYHKLEPTWLSGQAVYYALHSDLYSLPTRSLLHPYLDLLQFLSCATIVWETLGPLLLIAPWSRPRMLGLLGFSLMHLSFGFFLRLGIFVATPQLFFLALLPGAFWERWPDFPRLREKAGQWAVRWQAWSPPSGQLSLETSALLLSLVFYSVLQGIGNSNIRGRQNPLIPPYLRWVADWTGLNQRWAVFVNLPTLLDGWALVEAQLRDGTRVDLFQETDPFDPAKPAEVSRAHKHFRWPTPLVTIYGEPALQGWFVQALVWYWNDRHPNRRVARARFCFMQEPTLADYEDSPPRLKVIRDWTNYP